MTRVIQTAFVLLLCALVGIVQAAPPASIGAVDPSLQLPVVAGLLGNELDPEAVPAQGLDVTVAGSDINNAVVLVFQSTLNIYLADEAGQTLTSVSWPISARNAGKAVTLPLDKAVLQANLGKTLLVYYSVAVPRSAPRVSGVVPVLVKAGFSAGQTLDLSTRNYIVFVDSNGVVRPPPSIPDFAQYTRVQAGATGYTTDNDAIARVDGNGQVSVWGNGDVTVTAQTATGAGDSYVLSVRGVRALRLLSQNYHQTWKQAQAQAHEQGYRQPTIEDFQALLRLYPSNPGAFAQTFDLHPYWVWGQKVGAGTAVYLDLYDNLITSGRSSKYELGYPAGIR